MKTLRNVSPEIIDLFESEGYENRILTEYELKRRLDAHGNLWHTTENDIFVSDNGEDYVSAKDWTLFDLLDFLNY